MNKFEYRKVASPEEAAILLDQDAHAKLLAGGTDLLTLIKEEIISPGSLLDISAWGAGTGIDRTNDGVRIGAMCTLTAIARNVIVRSQHSALSDACRQAAAPQLRNMGTIGGNLLQQTRCWYFRGPFDCWLKGGEKCFARDGENEQHAIFHTAPRESVCVSAHPSDPAAALLALDAEIEYVSTSGPGRMALKELYRLPDSERRSFTTLPVGAVITAVLLPDAHGGRKSIYRKAMPRAAWAFALAGVAIVVELDGEAVVDARVGLSGVAPIPIRAREAEQLLSGRRLSKIDMDAVTTALTVTAEPLPMNGYKVDLLRGLFRQTFLELVADGAPTEREFP